MDGDLPKVISDLKFSQHGLVVTDSGLSVPAYVGSQLGFNAPGREYLKSLYAKLREVSVWPICPFKASDENLSAPLFDGTRTLDDLTVDWGRFNTGIGKTNYEQLMPYCKLMIAVMDGGHAIDDGLSAEIAYFAVKHGLVLGIRSDFRLAENIAAPINPAVRYFLDMGPFNGHFFYGTDAHKEALHFLKEFAQKLTKIESVSTV